MEYNEKLDRFEGYTDKKFFLPKFEGDPKEEDHYQTTRSFLIQTDLTHTDNRVYSIDYEINGFKKTSTVGELYNNTPNEPIIAIFESDRMINTFFIVTPRRGIVNSQNIISPPYMERATKVIYFREANSADSIR